jgi:hypothetical protein
MAIMMVVARWGSSGNIFRVIIYDIMDTEPV